MSWLTPITDRNEMDVLNNEPKAYLNAGDFNRIEGNVAYLANELKQCGYLIATPVQKEWNMENIPNKSDIQRICDTITGIVEIYYNPSTSGEYVNYPNERLAWKHINDLENILYLLKEMLDSGMHNNKHQLLALYRHEEMKPFTYGQLRQAALPGDSKPWMMPDRQIVTIKNRGKYSAQAVYNKYDYVYMTVGQGETEEYKGFLAKRNNIQNMSPAEAPANWQLWEWQI